MKRKDVAERVLMAVDDADETRKVLLVEGDSLAVVEVTEGPITEAAYGMWRHAHKMLGDAGVFARALGSDAGDVADALAAFFSAREGTGEEALLSELMDCLDRAGEPYTYVAWGAEGDAVLRVG